MTKNLDRIPGTIVRYETKTGPRFRALGFDGKKRSLGVHATEELALEALRTFNETRKQKEGENTHADGTLGAWVIEWWKRRLKEEHHRSLRDTEICIRRRILSHPISQMQLTAITLKVVTG